MGRRNRPRLRILAFLIAVVLGSASLCWITPWMRGPRIPSREEIEAIRVATQELSKLGYGTPDQVEARRLESKDWEVRCSFFLGPPPGGHRTDITFRVDARSKCLGWELRDWGAY